MSINLIQLSYMIDRPPPFWCGEAITGPWIHQSLKGCGTSLWHWAKGASLSAIPQCPAPREPKWKVCFSTRWVRRWKSFGMTWVYGRGTRGSTELFIPSGVLWLGSTHISCPLFSSCQSPCSPKLACLLMDYLDERVYPFIPFWSEYTAHPAPSESPHLSTPALPWGAVIKRWRGLELGLGGAGLWHWQGFGGTAVTVFMGAIQD